MLSDRNEQLRKMAEERNRYRARAEQLEQVVEALTLSERHEILEGRGE